MITYNQILDIFRAIADSHRQLRSFGIGDPSEFAASGDVEYPAMWVAYQPCTVDISSKAGNISFKLVFADLVHHDRTNEQEVLSDTQQIAFDFISILQLPVYQDYFTLPESTIRMEPIIEQYADIVCGWLVDITLRIDYLSSVCSVPADVS